MMRGPTCSCWATRPHDPRLAAADGMTLVPDMEYRHVDVCAGVWQIRLREGQVTCVSLYDTVRATVW